MDNAEFRPEKELSKEEKESGEPPLEDNPTEILEAFQELPPREKKFVSNLVAQISSGPSPSPTCQTGNLRTYIANNQ
ncbi:MAG: hypothetical protein JOZ78_23035 [Chroococcidiopsidaceae cyanobacterium CP_BM_ER_R8_30]|nr:hypothetical protein [Chroococcidiopsidaceae cyanobacterium CP_BM_ER_R8_30]